jgi:MFS family permease
MFSVSLGAVIQCSSFSVPQLMIGRFITGLGVGIDTSTVPMYQAELCKPEVRGRLVTTEVFFVALGVSSAYFLDFGFSFLSGPAAWRVPISLQIPMAMAVSVLVIGLPETPRWLLQKGRTDEAISVMVKVHDVPKTDAYVIKECDEIVKAIEIESSSPFKWSRIFQRDALQTGYRVALACLVLFMNQVCAWPKLCPGIG